MRSRVSLILLLGLAIACGSSEEVFAGELTAPVVYGEDDRVEVFNHPDADLQSIARESIVALIPTSWIERGPDGTYAPAPSVQSLGELRGLCPDELFVNQPAAAVCSGVLIDDDLVLTAGHCIDSRMPCDGYAYVFNYHLDDPNHLAVIRDKDVYSCARVVSNGRPPLDDYTPDFAVVQLDRPVEGAHVPALVRPATPLGQDESLAMIGFGSGLPAKIDTGGSVADPRAEQLDYFVANVDAFQGHSGSATFDSENRLAGILIGGRTPDYVTLDGESCERVAVHPDSPADELIHNIAPIVTTLCDDRCVCIDGLLSDDGWDAAALCGPKACEDQPCDSVPPPPVVPAYTSGCSTSTGSTGFTSGLLGLLLFAVARRFRRRAA